MDKLLRFRIAHIVQQATSPWQSGGSAGADDAAWLLVEPLKLLRKQGRCSKILLAFIDGESAFCRPPPEIILDELAKLLIDPSDWLAIAAILGHLVGTLLTPEGLSGSWDIEAGVPQGHKEELCRSACSL